MNERLTYEIVLAIYPTTRGIAFALMQSPLAPIDWGVKGAYGRDKNASSLRNVAALIEIHQPDVVVLEDPTSPRVRRSARIERLTRAVEALARDRVVDVHRYTHASVQECFSQFGARTRYEIAVAIATRVPAFERFLPPRRKLWMSEDTRMGIFRAAALALTHYGRSASGLPTAASV
ncbi:MAG TPA: hypothetical protein VMF32_04260 [Xanthobacteraceae bacterium]|nr:hypothetical protein [Xanthobacteraceae bacterium]